MTAQVYGILKWRWLVGKGLLSWWGLMVSASYTTQHKIRGSFQPSEAAPAKWATLLMLSQASSLSSSAASQGTTKANLHKCLGKMTKLSYNTEKYCANVILQLIPLWWGFSVTCQLARRRSSSWPPLRFSAVLSVTLLSALFVPAGEGA